ncbi:hypothetical protein C8Q80DRAFT_1215111, partial [Daedaleopsis nitida]
MFVINHVSGTVAMGKEGDSKDMLTTTSTSRASRASTSSTRLPSCTCPLPLCRVEWVGA